MRRCEMCGAELTRPKQRRFCSRSCAAKRPKNGGLSLSPEGRWRICCRDGSTVMFYRAVMEAHLRRPLRPDEHVHHINGDCSDDRIENLSLIAPGDHLRLHWDEWGRKDVDDRGCEVCGSALSRRQLLLGGRFCSQACMGRAFHARAAA